MKNVEVIVSDGSLTNSFEWKVNVLDYNNYLKLLNQTLSVS